MRKIVGRCVGHLRNALRFVLPLPTRPSAMRACFGELVLLAGLSITVAALVELAQAGEQAWFNPSGLASAIAEWTVFGALTATLWSGARAFRVTGILTAVAAVNVWLLAILAIFLLAVGYVQEASLLAPTAAVWASFGFHWLIFVWTLVALWRIGCTATADRPRRSGLGFVTVAVLSAFILPSTAMFGGPQTELNKPNLVGLATDWLRAPPNAEKIAASVRAPVDVESTYYRQIALLDASADALESSPEGRPSMYFLGFAGYAGQNVFRSELSQARDLFDHHFATRGRSLLLVNHRDSIKELPLASITNLAMALERIGRRMDKEKDILFLFLTSHGDNGHLSVSFPRFSLNHLTPTDLRGILDRSGIVNRVIVISACHSGSFLPALEEANTLIMTASRADRSSFGCDDKREWTYFGDALFNRALRQTRSLIGAFDLAKATVAGWEKAEGLTASEPQMFIGDKIGAKLESWERSVDIDQTQRSE